ncbi:MAG: DUF4145 domain-containing protein [Candidatus Saccharimonadales bacterium]
MTSRHYPPEYLKNQFNCSRCGVFAKQSWGNLETQYRSKNGYYSILGQGVNTLGGDNLPNSFVVSRCDHCQKYVVWVDEKIIYPRAILVEQPNPDLIQEIQDLYLESANILSDSPRAAAALLRLALQLLLKEVGGKGKNINDDIATITKNGVDSQVQKALDILRVFGNNGAHPGEINLNDDSTKVIKMFALLNFIANKIITQQKEIDNLFDELPETIKQQIDDRDSKSVGGKDEGEK